MFNFFIEEGNRHNNRYIISGADFNHIKNVLRMKIGDEFLVSENNVSNLCRIESFDCESVIAEIIEESFQDTRLPIKIYLFQGLPKSDKQPSSVSYGAAFEMISGLNITTGFAPSIKAIKLTVLPIIFAAIPTQVSR